MQHRPHHVMEAYVPGSQVPVLKASELQLTPRTVAARKRCRLPLIVMAVSRLQYGVYVSIDNSQDSIVRDRIWLALPLHVHYSVMSYVLS